MKYRLDKYGNKISALGFGCMRFHKTAGIIDKKRSGKANYGGISTWCQLF